MKFDVPLSIPRIDLNLFPARSFLSKLIVGVPAHTEASKRKLTPLLDASSKRISPYS